MIVYHGSSEVVRQPDILHSYRALDFGKGFYVTTVKEQAERWARRKAALVGTHGSRMNAWAVFITQRAIDELLRFEGHVEVWSVDDRILEQIYQENLEERLIAYIADQHGVSLEKAMDIYYSNDLAEKIHDGVEGIQYLDYKVLGQILQETEPERFR